MVVKESMTWGARQPGAEARVFSLAIGQAAFVAWDLERGVMTTRRWSPERGSSESERAYP